MLSIQEDLKTAEAAEAYNSSARRGLLERHSGCIDSLACVHCYHVISDSICLCAGSFDCPKCGGQNGFRSKGFKLTEQGKVITMEDWVKTIPFYQPAVEDYSI